MLLSSNLRQLSSLFPSPLYVVGGAVRDALLGFKNYDYDLASALTPPEVFALLKNSGFRVVHTSFKLHTLRIMKDGECYEYTSFRKDSYAENGAHTPLSVKLTNSIEEDAFRRDFSVNALYFDIQKEEYVDPTGGMQDIKEKKLRAVRCPYEVIAEDALRILRLVRFSAELGFSIEEQTFLAAKERIESLQSISKERIREEFNKMLVADQRNGVEGAHLRALRILDDLGAFSYIIPELLEGKGVEQRPDFHKYDVFEHNIRTCGYAEPSVRLAALLHDIAKPKMLRETGRMAGHEKAGAQMTSEILRRLRYSNKEIYHAKRLVSTHMYDYNFTTSEKKLRLFVLENHAAIDDIIALKNADTLATGMSEARSPSGLRLKAVWEKMKEEGIPLQISQLDVKGEDLIEINIPPRLRGQALEKLLKTAANDKSLHTREAQLKFLKNYSFNKEK